MGRYVVAALIAIVGLPASVVTFMMLSMISGGAKAQTLGTVEAGAQLKPGVIPQRYVGVINQAATTCPEVTAPLIAAQIQAESNWNANAVGPMTYTGQRARGIAQFMPMTWSTVGKDYNGNGVNSPMDPGDAIPAQAAYMCDQITRIRQAGLSGDVINLALAAYNAGFGAVQQYQGIPPYPETQKYVRKIRDLAAAFARPKPQPRPAPGGARGWVTPAQGTCTSGFGPRWGSFHKGQDIAGEMGSPIVAASTGTVIAAGPASGYGLWVKLRHPSGVVTIYGHVHTTEVTVGQQVQAGQTIATMGNRGQSTGTHLHYQVETGGQPVDPVTFHQSEGAPPLCG